MSLRSSSSSDAGLPLFITALSCISVNRLPSFSDKCGINGSAAALTFATVSAYLKSAETVRACRHLDVDGGQLAAFGNNVLESGPARSWNNDGCNAPSWCRDLPACRIDAQILDDQCDSRPFRFLQRQAAVALLDDAGRVVRVTFRGALDVALRRFVEMSETGSDGTQECNSCDLAWGYLYLGQGGRNGC